VNRFKRYANTPRGKFRRHKANAKRRGVPFEMTFEQWWAIWQESGRWDDRHPDGFCMCRTEDCGAYAIGNVYIGTKEHNTRDRNKNYDYLGFRVTRTIAGGTAAPF
jgi:hypothetical protein